jgi:PAS domain S-box-containing protein
MRKLRGAPASLAHHAESLIFPQSPAPATVRYAFAGACCAVAFALRLLLEPILHEQAPLLLFTLAAAASAIRGGFGPGALSTLIGAVLAMYFIPPKGEFAVAPEYLAAMEREMAVFIVVGMTLSALGGKLRQLRWQALELAAQRNEILESITDGFAALDANCCIVYLNRAAGELLQRPPGQLIGRNLWEQIPELRGSLLEATLRRVLREHAPVHCEYLFPLTEKWFEFHAHPTKNSGITVYFRDISDRKLSERRLLETLEERNAALERVQLLSGLLPICAWCKRIRDDSGNWQQMESYISQHSQAKFSHGMCPECLKNQTE